MPLVNKIRLYAVHIFFFYRFATIGNLNMFYFAHTDYVDILRSMMKVIQSYLDKF